MRLISSTILSLILVGCGSKMDVKRQVHIESDFNQHYTQDSKRLNHNDMLGKLRLNPAAGKQLEGYEMARAFTAIVGGAGGFITGWAVGVGFGSNPQWELLGVGVPLLVGSMLMRGLWVAPKLRRAVEIHNASVRKAQIIPWAAPQRTGTAMGMLLHVPLS